MVVNAERLRDVATQMSKLMKDVPQQIDRIKQEIELCEKEVDDLRHLIELTNFNASQGYKMSKDMQITLIKRRELKDELDSLVAVKAMMSKHRPMLAQSETLSSTIKQRVGAQKRRTYTPRVRTDLAPMFIK